MSDPLPPNPSLQSRRVTAFVATSVAAALLAGWLFSQEAERSPERRLLAQTAPAPQPPAAPSDSSGAAAQAPAPGQGPGPGSGAGPGGGPPRRPGFGPPGPGGGRGPGPGGGRGFGPGSGGGFRPGGPAAGTATDGSAAPGASFIPGMDTAETFTIEGDQVTLQFPNNPVADILSIYELLTGKTLVKDTNIFEGATISLMTPKPVSKDEAVRLIEMALLTNGYAIVAEPGGKNARILPTRGQGVSSMQFSAGVNFYTSPKDLPDGETLVTYFMKLDSLSPTEASEILANHVGLNVYGRITPVLIPPGLLITESATIVRQLIQIREAIDVPDSGSSLITKFIPLVYADAATVAQIVQATITAQQTERETKGIKTVRGEAQPTRPKEGDKGEQRSEQRREEQPRPQQQPIFYNGQWIYPPSQGPGSTGPTSQVVADTRLNQILVVAPPEDYTYIASLIAEFDKPLTVEEPYERKLNYASAIDVLPALTDLLKEATTGTTQLPGGGSLQTSAAGQSLVSTSRSQILGGRSTTTSRGGTVTSSVSGGASGVSADGTTTGTTSTGIGGRADVIQGPTEDNAPVSVLIGKTRIVADPMANSIIVIGRKEEAEKIDSLLDKLDRKPAQVYLATVIGQLTLGEGFEWGIDYLAHFDNGSASFITKNEDIITNNNVNDLRDNLISSAFGPAKGFNLYGQIGDSVEAFVHALETSNRFKVLSRPTVFALNNKKAVITSGQIIPVPAQSISVPGNANTTGSVTTTVEYRDVVLKLEVVPLINDAGEVNLTIAQVNDTIVGQQRVEPNDVPIIGTEQLVTSVNVPTGNTVVLGGLISEEKKKDIEGMPFISRVPLLGNLFKETVESKTRKELIIFIQPMVVTDDAALKQASYNEDIRTTVGEDLAKRFPQTPPPPEPKLDENKPKKKSFFSRIFSKSGAKEEDQAPGKD